MSKDLSNLDVDNLTDDEVQYFNERPWLKDEFKRVTGEDFPDSSSAGDETVDEDEEPEEESGYVTWEYQDLKSEVKKRDLHPESQSREDLVAALEDDDEDEDE